MADNDKYAVIIKTGEKIASLSTTEGDYEDWIASGISRVYVDAIVVDVARGESLPPLAQVAAILITGSGAMVTERTPWMEQSAAWLRSAVAASVPVLGICFGHQLLAYALGGEVGDNPRGLEVGSHTINLTDAGCSDPLFRGFPASFAAQLSHQQSVLRLPEGARLLASSDKDPNQAFAIGECAWGVQFHPEFNKTIVQHFIRYYRDMLHRQGGSADVLLTETVESPESASLLSRFAELANDCNQA